MQVEGAAGSLQALSSGDYLRIKQGADVIDSTIMFFVTPILDGDLGQGSYDIRATKAVVARGKQQGRRHQPKMWGATNPKGTVRTMYCVLYALSYILHTVYCLLSYHVLCVVHSIYCALCTIYCVPCTVYFAL